MKQIIVLVALLLVSSFAYADCQYDGTSYPEGTIVNGYVCKPDGTWGN